MRWGVVVLGLFTGFAVVGVFGGCGFSSPSARSTDACETFASQFDTCMLTFDGDLTLSGTITYDTAMHELKVGGAMMPVAHMTFAAGAGDVDAIFAHNVRFAAGAQLRATGMLPFAIVASGSVALEDGATIDVSDGGAGAQASCANPPVPGGDDPGGAGGGGGAGYGAAGGKGGDGNSDSINGTPSMGGAGGTSIAGPMGLVGGCPGAIGGTGIAAGSPGNTGGPGGLGGGALYIVAADRIELRSMAVLTAGGGGGHGGGNPEGGGGGGGSGGMILLESPHVIGLEARVATNGGGGGEGSQGGGPVGNDGETGSTSTSRALGGSGAVAGGAEGGRGGSLEEPTGEAVTMVLGGAGGGGGGGVGFIHIVSGDIQLGTVSPAAQ